MQIAKSRLCRALTRTIFLPAALLAAGAIAQAAPGENGNGKTMSAKRAQIVQFWTKDRRDAATPRDLRIDPRGLGYLRRSDGSLQPYGHQVAAQAGQTPRAKPPSGTGPTEFTIIHPTSGSTIGSSDTFSATVTDPDGLRSVSFVIEYPNGNTQSFAPSQNGSTWSISLSGFTDGNWRWWIVAKDGAAKGGNTTTSDKVNFSVSTGGEPPPPPPPPPTGDTVTNSEWLNGGAVQTATGRIYFQMPNNPRRKRWSGYVCSGTVTNGDLGMDDRSVIVTAAHCVYDDANKAFARNVLFIPDQAGTTGTGTDTNCGNDPYGCWTPSFGVVDSDWTTRTFPDNIPWDYAYYVVDDQSGAHSGNGGDSSIALDGTVATLPIQFSAPSLDTYTHALGYSYSDDPNFMYCAENMSTEGSDNWWLASCELSGGSSGGPWVQPMDTDPDDPEDPEGPVRGTGPLISVNSWGYTTAPGMAGPKLYGTSAQCLFNLATGTSFSSVPSGDGDEGVSGC